MLKKIPFIEPITAYSPAFLILNLNTGMWDICVTAFNNCNQTVTQDKEEKGARGKAVN